LRGGGWWVVGGGWWVVSGGWWWWVSLGKNKQTFIGEV
jgi:hypothetical protein